MERVFITVRATGERIYLDDLRPKRSPPPADFVPPPRPAPPIYIECELCGWAEMQIEWVRELPPFICTFCMTRNNGLKLDEAPWSDQVFLGRAHAVVRTIEAESHRAR